MWRLGALRQSGCNSWVTAQTPKRIITIRRLNAIDVNTTLESGNSSTINRTLCDKRTIHVAAMSRSAQTPAPRLPTLKNMEKTNTTMGDLAHTTSARQVNSEFRTEGIVSPEGDKTRLVPTNPVENGNVVFVFTGSASQFDGMGKQLYDTSPFVRQLFQQHDAICREHNLPSFIDLITQNNMTFASASPIQTQLAIVSFDLVMANLWQHWGIQPNAVTGFSLGQFPALVMAGVTSGKLKPDE